MIRGLVALFILILSPASAGIGDSSSVTTTIRVTIPVIFNNEYIIKTESGPKPIRIRTLHPVTIKPGDKPGHIIVSAE